jgi:hypothetical protein
MITSTLSTYFYASKFSQQPQASAFMQKASSNPHPQQDVFFEGQRASVGAAVLAAGLIGSSVAHQPVTDASGPFALVEDLSAKQTGTTPKIIDGKKPLSTKDKLSGNYGRNTAYNFLQWVTRQKSTVGVTLRLTPEKSKIKEKILNVYGYSNFIAQVLSGNKKDSKISKKDFINKEGVLLGSTLLSEKLFGALDLDNDQHISLDEYILYVNQATMKTRFPGEKAWKQWNGKVKVDSFWDAAIELTKK